MSDVVKGVCKEKVNTETSIYILWDQFLPLFSVLLLELEFYLLKYFLMLILAAKQKADGV